MEELLYFRFTVEPVFYVPLFYVKPVFYVTLSRTKWDFFMASKLYLREPLVYVRKIWSLGVT